MTNELNQNSSKTQSLLKTFACTIVAVLVASAFYVMWNTSVHPADQDPSGAKMMEQFLDQLSAAAVH